MSGPSWNPGVWEGIREAMFEQVERTAAARKFIPQFPVPESSTSVPRGEFEDGQVVRGVTVPIVEIYANFRLTGEQVEREESFGEGRNAAVNRARDLARAEDLLIFQGRWALDDPATLPAGVVVRDRQMVAARIGDGLCGTDWDVVVPPQGGTALSRWGANTVAAVSDGTNVLNDNDFYGPFALVLKPRQLADTRTPVNDDSLLIPYEPIRAQVDQFESTRTLPTWSVQHGGGDHDGDVGLVVSLGGESVDLAMSDPRYRLEFMQIDEAGMYVFRVSHRFALRIKRDGLAFRMVFI